MLVNSNGTPTFTVEQTIQPFTETKRMFNQKEADSTMNCVSGSCADVYVKDSMKQMNKLSSELSKTLKPGDTRNGLLNQKVEFFSQENGNDPIWDTTPVNTTTGPVANATNISNSQRYHDSSNASSNASKTQRPAYVDPNKSYEQMMDFSNNNANNSSPKDYTYNSYADWRAPSFNQWTRSFDDNCNEENRLRIGSKPMKYYVNQLNSPQVDPFQEYSIIGNQKAYSVRNEYERAVPTRLNPIYPVQVLPYQTTPFYGNTAPDRMYADTESVLRWAGDVRPLKSQTGNSEKDWNRYDIVAPEVVQNAGQFNQQDFGVSGMHRQQAISSSLTLTPESASNNGYYNYRDKNNVILGNSATPYFGLSSRNLLHNAVQTSHC